MAKQQQEDKGGKIRLVVFDMEGSNETLQESLRTVANALARGVTPNPPAPRPAPKAIGAGRGNGNGARAAAALQPAPEEDNYEDAIEAEATPAPAPKPKAKNNTQRQLPTPQMIDLDLTSGDVPLKTFLEQKKPNGYNERYLAIAYWLKTYRNIADVTMNHVYSCYRFMGWNVPEDASSPLRGLKKQGWMNKAKGKGAYTVNHVGENVLNNMGQAESAS